MLKSARILLTPSFRTFGGALIGSGFCSVSSTHKLSYGQGGYCSLQLLRNNYNIEFETIWEDHCLLQIEGEPAGNKLTVLEEGNQAKINDNGFQDSPSQINIKYKIPEDYTFWGEVNGSIRHLKSQVSNKLRCNKMNIKLVGKNRVFQWGSMECPQPTIHVDNGAIDINGLTFENGEFKCDSFASRKVLFSGKFNLHANNLAHIRSVVTYGSAVAKICARFVEIQSISGTFEIDSERVKIERLWASPLGINVKTQRVEKIGIETGTGIIQSTQPISQSAVTLGRLHKGKINRINHHQLVIE